MKIKPVKPGKLWRVVNRRFFIIGISSNEEYYFKKEFELDGDVVIFSLGMILPTKDDYQRIFKFKFLYKDKISFYHFTDSNRFREENGKYILDNGYGRGVILEEI